MKEGRMGEYKEEETTTKRRRRKESFRDPREDCWLLVVSAFAQQASRFTGTGPVHR